MNKTYTVLIDNKLEEVVIKEQETSLVTATKSIETLNEAYKYDYTNGVVYKLVTHTFDRYASDYAYNWKVIESQYSGDSNLGNFYSTSETKGTAIKRMLDDGFTVVVDGVEILKT